MAEEFEESEVIFSHDIAILRREEENPVFGCRENSDGEKSRDKTRTKTAAFSNSLPVNIPENVFRKYTAAEDYSDDDYSDGGGEIIPPHLIAGRRIEGRMAFSVCTGNGRTLKGRDLSRVRNSVLRLTGFLEA